MNVLIVAAHPDDELLGVGGTAAKHAKNGDSVFAIVASEGASARYSAGMKDSLKQSAEKAGKILGFRKMFFLGLPDQKLDTVPILDLTRKIEAIVAETKPHTVYTHFNGDANADHRLLFEAVLVACRPQSGVKAICCFETPSSTEWGASAFQPDTFVDITATLQAKLKAMREYSSELRDFPHPRSIEGLEALAKVRGMAVGVKAAEGFVTIRRTA